MLSVSFFVCLSFLGLTSLLVDSTSVANCNIESSFTCKNSTLSDNSGDCCWLTDGGYCDVCPPTSSPTLRPTRTPITAAPSNNDPTAAPVIQGPPKQIGDFCYCSYIYGEEEDESATFSPTMAPTTAPSHKKDKGGASHYGDCDCDKTYGLVELRLRWMGSNGVTNLQFYHNGYSEPICNYSDVDYGQEFTCNIWEYTDSSGVTYTDFDTNTYFVINHALNGSCNGKYHTSCSSDIVGTYSTIESGGAHCAQLYCTGWKDGNPTDGNSCDDGDSACLCENQTTTTPPPTTSTTTTTTSMPENTQVGDFCYCPSNGVRSAASNHTGDCVCDKDYGLVELRLRWTGNYTVDTLDFYYKNDYSENICSYTDLQYGEEFICHIWNYTDSSGSRVYDDFDKNTYFIANRSGTDNMLCHGSYHTSCSSDIVATYSAIELCHNDDGMCGLLYCTGWRDGNPTENSCDDGLELCSCNTTDPTPRPTVSPTLQPVTRAPITPWPTTPWPTEEPTTADPTTGVPTTGVPTSDSPTTGGPVTPEPTTPDPTTAVPTAVVNCDSFGEDQSGCESYPQQCCFLSGSCYGISVCPTPTPEPTPVVTTTSTSTTTTTTTTSEPTDAPVTKEPTTVNFVSSSPTTASPVTDVPTTGDPTSAVPTTADPSFSPTGEPTTKMPTTVNYTSGEPTTESPSTEFGGSNSSNSGASELYHVFYSRAVVFSCAVAMVVLAILS